MGIAWELGGTESIAIVRKCRVKTYWEETWYHARVQVISQPLHTMPMLPEVSKGNSVTSYVPGRGGYSLSGGWGSVSVAGVILLTHVLIVIGCISFMVPVLCAPVAFHHIHLQAIHAKCEKEQCQLMTAET